MSQIPSNLPASAAQAAVQANEVAKERDARQAGQVETVRRQVKSIDEAGSTVDTEDGDVAIFADAEGSGSQGREEKNADEAETDGTESEDQAKGIRRDDDGQLHVDLEA